MFYPSTLKNVKKGHQILNQLNHQLLNQLNSGNGTPEENNDSQRDTKI
jgi:hypothetical protein